MYSRSCACAELHAESSGSTFRGCKIFETKTEACAPSSKLRNRRTTCIFYFPREMENRPRVSELDPNVKIGPPRVVHRGGLWLMTLAAICPETQELIGNQMQLVPSPSRVQTALQVEGAALRGHACIFASNGKQSLTANFLSYRNTRQADTV